MKKIIFLFLILSLSLSLPHFAFAQQVGEVGDTCKTPNDCSVDYCVNNVCSAGEAGDVCNGNGDCSGDLTCKNKVCASTSSSNTQSTTQAKTNGFTALAPIPGLTDKSSTALVNSDSLANFFNNLYKYLIGLAAILAIIQIMWAGFDMAWEHKDSVSAITDDKGRIKNAIFGLVLILSPAVIFSIINPSILNLSIGLQPLDMSKTTMDSSGSGTGNDLLTQDGKPPITQTKSTSGCATATNGPLSGTFYTTCTATDEKTASSEAASYVAANCPTSGTKTGGAYAAVGSDEKTTMDSNNNIKKYYSTYSAKAWCSQIIKITGVYQKSLMNSEISNLIGYFNASDAIGNINPDKVCGNWSLSGSFKVDNFSSSAGLDNSGGYGSDNLGPCPSDDSFQKWFLALKGKNDLYVPTCGDTSFYCVMPIN